MPHELNEEEIRELYAWIDAATFSRPKRNLTRDFSDGVACAELIHHYVPKLVELHNYPPSNSLAAKMYNWHTLNNKLFKKLGYTTTLEIMTCIVHMRPGYVEYLLWDLKQKVPNFLTKVEQYLGISTDSKSGRSRTVSGDKKNKSAATRRRIQIDDHQSKSPQSNRSKKASETSQSKFEMDDRSHFDPAGDHKPHNPEEYEETIKIMALKMQRMEELLKLKDGKIQELSYS